MYITHLFGQHKMVHPSGFSLAMSKLGIKTACSTELQYPVHINLILNAQGYESTQINTWKS